MTDEKRGQDEDTVEVLIRRNLYNWCKGIADGQDVSVDEMVNRILKDVQSHGVGLITHEAPRLSDRAPVPSINSIIRNLIGWEKEAETPGTISIISDISATTSSFVFPVLHSGFDFRYTYVSAMSGPIGSVTISGRPIRLTTVCTSGISFSAFSMSVV
jgi:hypothetical protein